MLRAAIIGFGGIACGRADGGRVFPLNHLEAYARFTDRVAVVAVADPVPARRELALRLVPGARVYADAAEVLAAGDLDVVSLCAGADHQPGLLRAAIDAGIPRIWCEKPVARDAAEAAELADAADRRGVRVQVNFWRRFVPEIGAALADIRGGGLGDVHHVSGLYAETLFNNGSHLLDLIQAVAGAPVALTAQALPWGGTDPAVVASGCLSGGATFALAAVPRRDYNIFELDVVCQRGRVRLAENGRRVEILRDRPDADFPPLRILDPVPEILPCRWREAFAAALGELLDGSASSTLANAARVTATLASLASAAQRRADGDRS